MKWSPNFIVAVVIIAAFHHATALKCYIGVENGYCSDTPDEEVRECPSWMPNPGCYIGQVGPYTTCYRGCLQLPPEGEGCFTEDIDGEVILKECICTSDGCNENFAGWLENQ